MGIFSFFKNKKSAKSEMEAENVAFDEIDGWLGGKSDSLAKDERKILGDIGGRFDEFYVSIEERLGVLEEIDIEARKEHGRAKLLVRQGLDKYVNFVRALIKDMKAIEKVKLEKFAVELGKTFTHFEKTSASSYGRATYLIGDEMAAVRNAIRKFYNETGKLIEEYKSLIDDLRRIENVSPKLKGFRDIEDGLGGVREEISANETRVEKCKKNAGKLEIEIEEIKNSSEYASGLKSREEIRSLRLGLDNEIGKLKDLIDFKRLTSIVHSNQRELKIVKDHKDRFASEFPKDGGKRILGLLKGCNMKSSLIDARVDLIEKKKLGLDEKCKNAGTDYTVDKLKEIERVAEMIDGIRLDNVKLGRRLEEFELKLKGVKNEIVGLVEGFGVRVG